MENSKQDLKKKRDQDGSTRMGVIPIWTTTQVLPS